MPAARFIVAMTLAVSGQPLLHVRATPQYVLGLEVVDRAGTSAEAVSQAEHTVAHIFASAGLSLRWRFDAAAAPTGTVVSVVLLPAAAVERMAEFQSAHVLAFAGPPSARRVWIDGMRVRQSATIYGTSEGVLLGHVIAHETFHALGLGHSSHGLMRSSPRSIEGVLDRRISSGEVVRIHAALDGNRATGRSCDGRDMTATAAAPCR
jgi:hypothetical protein